MLTRPSKFKPTMLEVEMVQRVCKMKTKVTVYLVGNMNNKIKKLVMPVCEFPLMTEEVHRTKWEIETGLLGSQRLLWPKFLLPGVTPKSLKLVWIRLPM